MPIEISIKQPQALVPVETTPRSFNLQKPKAFDAKERMFFMERLALLLETGCPLFDSLEALRRQAAGQELESLIGNICENVASGRTFSQALAQHPKAFSPTYVNLIAAGEEGGFLQNVLKRLREMEEKRQELRSTLVAAFTYPVFLMVFSLGVVLFVLVVVFPKFQEIFTMIADELPITTIVLMAASEHLRTLWLPILVVLVAGGIFGKRFFGSSRGEQALDRFIQRIPGIRDVVTQYYLVQFMQIMSLSLGNGVLLLDALRSCREIVRVGIFRSFIEELESDVHDGKGVKGCFERASFLPPLVPQMIATGEESGSLAMVMGRVADFYERDWRKKLTLLAKIIEPSMLLVMGLVVGVLVSALLLPIFKLSSAIR